MSGLKGKSETNKTGPVYTISSSVICTKLEEDEAAASYCNISPSSSGNLTANDLTISSPVVINMNYIESKIVNDNVSNKSSKNHVKFDLEDSYSDNIYLKPYCKYPDETRYYCKNSCKENLKTLCKSCTEFMKKAGKWFCLIFVILGLILFFCLKMDFHR